MNEEPYTIESLIQNHAMFPLKQITSYLTDLCAEVIVFSKVTGTMYCQPQQTTYKHHPLHKSKTWNEIITFPIRLQELSVDACLGITIKDVFSPSKICIIGSVIIPFFVPCTKQVQWSVHSLGQFISMPNVLFWNQGLLRCEVFPKQTIKEVLSSSVDYSPVELQQNSEVERLELLLEEFHQNGKMGGMETKSLWLDRLIIAKIGQMRRAGALEEPEKGKLFLNVELSSFEHPVVYYESSPLYLSKLASTEVPPSNPSSSSTNSPLLDRKSSSKLSLKSSKMPIDYLLPTYQIVEDLEVDEENLAETLNLKLEMNLLRGYLDKELKPNTKERRILSKIFELSPLQEITQREYKEHKELLRKYRYWLTSEKKALTKFCKVMDWNSDLEKKEASAVLSRWVDVDFVDVLELLSREFAFVEPVRDYAVKMLKKTSDEILVEFLLQLVQAIKYEDASNLPSLSLEKDSKLLSALLIKRAVNSFTMANSLFWYIKIEMENAKYKSLYEMVFDKFASHLKQMNPHIWEQLEKQEQLCQYLTTLCTEMKENKKDSRVVKVDYLREFFAKVLRKEVKGWENLFTTPLMVPIFPTIPTYGIIPSDVSIFASNASPIRLHFATNQFTLEDSKTPTPHYKIIFKTGDDLRTDQLVLQIVSYVDKLLKISLNGNFLVPYKTFACSTNAGMVEMVSPSTPLSQVGNVKEWLTKQNQNNPTLIEKALDNFVKSCAGYSVLTYVLGVGDRHLDNILLTPDGMLFHIDFGFILGRDPKYGAPPMKLCREMVEGMGGSSSERYKKFLDLSGQIYLILRRHANLLINLFVLMLDANLENIDEGAVVMMRNNTTPTTKQHQQSKQQYYLHHMKSNKNHNILKMQEKLRLDLSEQEAVVYIKEVIRQNERAFFDTVNEAMHRWAMYWKQ